MILQLCFKQHFNQTLSEEIQLYLSEFITKDIQDSQESVDKAAFQLVDILTIASNKS